ncbi:hypothetical protein KA111_01045 [Candidatus Woesebacteria bacterium]|nr:hypothetical protein [Candidatus Woesebacteria bacterium]
MELPNLFSTSSDKENKIMTIFIDLTDIKIQSFLLSIANDGIKTLSKSEVASYEGADNCLVRVDESLQQLGKESENVSSVIFGLNNSWVRSGEVIAEKKPLLKRLTDDLSLKPMGFIVISEAIVQQKISADSIFSGIISVFSSKDLILSLVHQGKVKSIEIVGRSSDSKGDFLEGLARFADKSKKDDFYLPSKIILASLDLDAQELKEQQQYIYDYDWKAQTQFLKPPTVTAVTQKEYEEMITKEAAKAVALQKGMTAAAMTIMAKNNSSTDLNKKDLGFSEVSTDDESTTDFDDNDFNKEPENNDDDFDVDSKDEAESPTSFGVPISNKNFDKELISSSANNNLKEPDFEDDSELAVDFSNKDADKTDDFGEETKHIFDDNRGHHSSVVKPPEKVKKHYKNFRLYSIVGFVAGLVALAIIAFFGISYASTMEIVLELDTKPISKDLEITLDSTVTESDSENLILAADKTTKEMQSESMMQTTGIKIVGEKAKGKVVIYNNIVSGEKLLEKGTILSAGDIKFELDADVTVPAANAPSPGKLNPGEIEATVTAAQIGADANIAEKTELAVVPYDKSSYYAYSLDEDFVGGASREVKVVSEDDRSELLADLKKELTEKINQEFANESVGGKYILPSKNIITEDASFNFEVGNEAEELTLDLAIEIEALTYTAEDLKPLATKVLASEIPENYKLSDADPQILSAPTDTDLNNLEEVSKTVTLSANISSLAIPVLSEEEVRNEIAGKSLDEAKQILIDKSTIKGVEITINPSIAKSFIKKLPGNVEKIKVEFK